MQGQFLHGVQIIQFGIVVSHARLTGPLGDDKVHLKGVGSEWRTTPSSLRIRK